MTRTRTGIIAAAGATAAVASVVAGAALLTGPSAPANAPAANAPEAVTTQTIHANAKHYITLFESEDGYRTAHPFSSPITPSGGIYAGSNYVYCKVWGDKVSGSYGYNHWWLKTDLDWHYSGKPSTNQYISAYGLSGQGNDQANGIPSC